MASIIDNRTRWLRRIGIVAILVVAAAAGCNRQPTTDDWLQQLKDSDVLLRRQACRELGNLPSDATRTVSALADGLRDENWYVRRDAAIALGKIGPAARDAAPALVTALADKQKSVHAAAAAALKKVNPQAAAKAGVR